VTNVQIVVDALVEEWEIAHLVRCSLEIGLAQVVEQLLLSFHLNLVILALYCAALVFNHSVENVTKVRFSVQKTRLNSEFFDLEFFELIG
jgi:hypothetical protein